jgi:hypothetical protein
MRQQQAWMAYSCSVHFSEQLSYRKHFIPSYRLKDMNFARYRHFLGFWIKQKKAGTFLTKEQLAQVTDARDQALLTVR